MSNTNRRLVTLDQFAHRAGISQRTVRRYIGDGHFPAYQVPGVQGIMVDLDEALAALRRIPNRRTQTYGPNAKIVRLPAQAVVVPEAGQ